MLGAVIAAVYVIKAVTLLQMKGMEAQRRRALEVLKRQEREKTPEAEVYSVPVTPDTPHGRTDDDDWHVQEY